MIFTNVDNAIVDPKDFSNKSFVERKTDVCVIPPNSFVLLLPLNIFAFPKMFWLFALGKAPTHAVDLSSTSRPRARWEGHVTLEISNTTPLPAKVYANEGVAQFLFFKGSSPCEVTYAY